jgi:thiamine-phosphate pyrophosphorylase
MVKTGDFGFYGILTNPAVGYERLAAIMVDKRVRYIQLRMKDCPLDEIEETARRVREVVKGESLFIVNDHPEVALAVRADGVHLGQDDMPYEEARKMLGAQAIIGLSTHNLSETRAASALAPDYIGVGPVYATPTKKIPDPIIGLGGMKAMLAAATVPAVAIGGIALENVKEVLQGGARNISAVRCVNRAEDPASVLDQMIRAVDEYSPHRVDR